jgi:hypothetical protein
MEASFYPKLDQVGRIGLGSVGNDRDVDRKKKKHFFFEKKKQKTFMIWVRVVRRNA